jgi:hypothetical protein
MSNNFTTNSCWTDNGQPGVTLNQGAPWGCSAVSTPGPISLLDPLAGFRGLRHRGGGALLRTGSTSDTPVPTVRGGGTNAGAGGGW